MSATSTAGFQIFVISLESCFADKRIACISVMTDQSDASRWSRQQSVVWLLYVSGRLQSLFHPRACIVVPELCVCRVLLPTMVGACG